MEALLTSLGAVVTAVLSYVGSICTTIVGQPVLLLLCVFCCWVALLASLAVCCLAANRTGK